MSDHVCPKICHVCPDMIKASKAGGTGHHPACSIMPFCDGVAITMPYDAEDWREYCYCATEQRIVTNMAMGLRGHKMATKDLKAAIDEFLDQLVIGVQP